MAHFNTKTHCKRGHELTSENVSIKKHGRQCRLCINLNRLKRTPESRHAEYVRHAEGYKRRTKEWVAANPERDRNNNYLKKYGITTEQYEALLKQQDGKCLTCGKEPTRRRLAVDHDHACCPDRKQSCGKCIRGLLCDKCNLVLGMVNDDPKILGRMVEYLTAYPDERRAIKKK